MAQPTSFLHGFEVRARGTCVAPVAPLPAFAAPMAASPTSVMPETGQPGRRFPQLEQVESVTRLPKPQFGQRFMPSVLTA